MIRKFFPDYFGHIIIEFKDQGLIGNRKLPSEIFSVKSEW